jgi:hypothetical protein
MIGQQYLPIGRNYKQHVFEYLKTISTQPNVDQQSL